MTEPAFDGVVRPVHPDDRSGWTDLFEQYRSFYELAPDAQIAETTWQWLIGNEHGLTGLVAETRAGELAGLAHFRQFARPSSGSVGVYLDDLFTAPSVRKQGVASALIAEVSHRAFELDATVVRWITADDNHTARSLYDQVGKATRWITYDLEPRAR